MNRLNTRSWARAAGSLLPLLALLLSTPVAVASNDPVFSGSVTDALGNMIEDVEVLAVTGSTRPAPAAAVRSDRSGSFSFDSLSPGIYTIVALKNGYLTFVGSVNTRAQSWVEVILHPAPPPGSADAAAIPSDSSWVLRLPRRSILRELDDRLPVEPDARDEATRAARGGVDDQLHLRVDQLFSAGPNLWGDDGNESRLEGMETRLHVASSLGERGRLEFAGSRESRDSAPVADDPASASSSDSSALQLDLSYDTGLDSRLAVKAFFSEQDMSFPADAGEAALRPERRELRSWGYDAGWSRQLDAGSSLELQLDYRDRSLEMEEGAFPVSGRTIGASGSYLTLPAVGHQVEVGFKAQLLDSPEGALPLHGGELNRRQYEPAGMSIGLDAQDTWVISGPFALVYGIGYKHALTSLDTSLIVPRVGGTLSVDRLIMRLLVSYHRVESWGIDEATSSDRPFRSGGAVGYEAQFELPLAAGIHLTAATGYSPVDMTFPSNERTGRVSAGRPVYYTDGNASFERRSLSLTAERAAGRMLFEVGTGRVEGFLAPASINDSSFCLLSDGRLRYRTGKLGIHIPASGTDLTFDWREVLAAAGASGHPATESAQRSLELHVAQDLVRLRTAGSWRLLMALRRAELEAGGEEAPLLAGYTLLQPPINHQVSAGLSVLF